MKASNTKGDARTVGSEGCKIHCLWRALEQGLFPFMMNEVGELTEKNKVFVAVWEAALSRGRKRAEADIRQLRNETTSDRRLSGVVCRFAYRRRNRRIVTRDFPIPQTNKPKEQQCT